ncbi:Uncharacterized protein FWK35_00017951 [Aphis craccivora]|uniref:Uncharacterized protein n=1 Tax=Aphis craccivora TaxID=307492 RepID=A0A6G0YEG7_APHCR|nr:Uncharacterized protein FWK35_00017951 [Aphis craccivora]
MLQVRGVILGGVREEIITFLCCYNASCRYDQNGQMVRLCHGFLVRAPQHARSSSDRVNIFTVEMVNIIKRSQAYAKKVCNSINMYHKVSRSKFIVLIKQNAIMKIDPSYLNFCANSLFVTANMVGKLVVNNPRNKGNEEIDRWIHDFIGNHKGWISQRLTEGVINSMIAGSCEEGLFGQVKKVFMMMTNLRRGNKVACWDIESFARKCNECMVDKPLAMHYQTSVNDILNSWDEKSRQFILEI